MESPKESTRKTLVLVNAFSQVAAPTSLLNLPQSCTASVPPPRFSSQVTCELHLAKAGGQPMLLIFIFLLVG
jgi:hypothetical protein